MDSKKMIRSNKTQIHYLCHYMSQHPDFAAGDFKTPLGAAAMENQWKKVKAALDEIGPNRTVEQWKVCWRDQKRKARVEGGSLNRAMAATGNSVPVPELSLQSHIILDTIGMEMATGSGPPESTIGIPVSTPQVEPATQADVLPNSPVLVQSPTPPAKPPPAKRSRLRKTQPPDRFLKAQEEHNKLLKEILVELRLSNALKKEQNNILQRRSSRKLIKK